MPRQIVAYTKEDANDVNVIITALQEHRKKMSAPSNVKNKEGRKRYLERLDKMIQFYTEIWVKIEG